MMMQTQVVTVRRRGGPEALALVPRELPAPAGRSVQVEVEASGVAYGDLLLREGLVPGTEFPVVPGYDAVGRVLAVGSSVDAVRVGDRVAVRTDGTGGYATVLEADPDFVVPVPETVDAGAAVALVLNYVTAWQMLTRVAPVGVGGSVLVHGASGGVGSALSELAAVRGLTVLGTASAAHHDGLVRRGVHAIDRAGDWPQAVRAAASDNGGVDAVFDPIGGSVTKRSLDLLAPGGQVVTYGASGVLQGGRRSLTGAVRTFATSPRVSTMTLFRRGTGVNGYMSATYVPAHPTWFRADLSELLGMLDAGRIAPVIAQRLPLDQAAEAHRLLAGGVSGKIVLTPPAATS